MFLAACVTTYTENLRDRADLSTVEASRGETGQWKNSSTVNAELTFWYVADSKQPNSSVSVNRPLLRLTVGLTAVVHEAGVVSFGAGIDDPVLKYET